MDSLSGLARLLIMAGGLILVAGLFLFLIAKILTAGRLPGDILIRKGHLTFFFPVVTCLLLSLFLTLILNLFRR